MSVICFGSATVEPPAAAAAAAAAVEQKATAEEGGSGKEEERDLQQQQQQITNSGLLAETNFDFLPGDVVDGIGIVGGGGIVGIEKNSNNVLTLGSLLDLLLDSKKIKLDMATMPFCLASKRDVPLKDFLTKDRFFVSTVQEFTKVKFVIKQKISTYRFKLLFDGRFLSADLSPIFLPFHSKQPTWHIVLDKDWEVERCTKTKGNFPTGHTLHSSCNVKVSFGELVLGKEQAELKGFSSIETDPQSQPETVELLKKWGLSGSVNVDFCVATLPISVPVCWVAADPAEPVVLVDGKPRVTKQLEAFTGSKTRIRFRRTNRQGQRKRPGDSWLLPSEQPASKRPFEFAAAAAAAAAAAVSKGGDQINPISKEDDRSGEANRSSATSVHLVGLTLALKLGMLSVFKGETGEETFFRLCFQMRRAFGYIWLQRDPLGRVCFITYLDGYMDSPLSFEIASGSLDPSEFGRLGKDRIYEVNEAREENCWQSWKKFFDFLWTTRDFNLSRKNKAALPLFDKWGPAKENSGGTHGRCYSSVCASLSKVRVFCFSRDDSSIHSLKLFFARYCEEVRHLKRGVQLRTVTGTKIICLQTSEIEVENVSQFLDFSGNSPNPKGAEGDPDADSILRACKDWCPHLVADTCFETARVQEEDFAHRGGGRLQAICEDKLEKRGNFFVKRLSATHLAFCDYLCQRFLLDLSTSPFLTLSSVSFRVAMLDFWRLAGPTAQSLEKTKPHWEDKLRNLCRGGFSYSCRDSVSSGVSLLPEKDSEKAFSIAEFDLKSCYGYSLQNMQVPGAFAVGYTFYPAASAASQPDPAPAGSDSVAKSAMQQKQQQHSSNKRLKDSLKHLFSLKRTDVCNRAKSFEYLAVQAVVRSSVASFGSNILGVWSNFSPLGILYFGKYPVDLALIFEGRGLFLFNFDGQFAHSCPTGNCPSLPNYVGGATEESVLEATRERDAFFNNWIKDNNYRERKLQAYYHVINDCHHPQFGYRNLLKIEELWELRKSYESLPKKNLSFPSDLLLADPDLTFLLIGRGAVPTDRREGQMPLFVWNNNSENNATVAKGGGRQSQNFGWKLEGRDYLFTRDSFEHLVNVKGFEFSSVSDVYFYKKCKVLPLVFGGLVSEREIAELAGNETRANFLKAAVNFTTGMFGMKAGYFKGGGNSKARLVSKFSIKACECTDRIDIKVAGSVSGKTFYVFQRTAPARKTGKRAEEWKKKAAQKRRKATDASLPIYASVVEFGKLRLLNCLEFLRAHIRIAAVRILYSQVDNLVLAMSGERLEEAVLSEKREIFECKKDQFFGREPGKLVEKWKVSAEGGASWSFASARICSYGLISKDKEGTLLKDGESGGGQTKMSGLTGISSLAAFKSNCRLLAGLSGLQFPQERRVNRLLNQDTVTKVISNHPLSHSLLPSAAVAAAAAADVSAAPAKHDNKFL